MSAYEKLIRANDLMIELNNRFLSLDPPMTESQFFKDEEVKRVFDAIQDLRKEADEELNS